MQTGPSPVAFMMNRKWLALCWVGWLGTAALARGQSPSPPAPIPAASAIAPDDANVALRNTLSHRYVALVLRFQAWRKRADAFNRRYGGLELDADSPEAKEGSVEEASLAQESREYQAEAEKFKREVGLLRLRPAGGPVATAPSP